jgi:hypothetical protein
MSTLQSREFTVPGATCTVELFKTALALFCGNAFHFFLPTTPWSALPDVGEGSVQQPPDSQHDMPEPVVPTESRNALPRDRSPSPEAAPPNQMGLADGSPSALRRSPRLVARYSKSPSPAPPDLSNNDRIEAQSQPSLRRSPRLAGSSAADGAQLEQVPPPAHQTSTAGMHEGSQQARPEPAQYQDPVLRSPTAVRSGSKRRLKQSPSPRRRGPASASPKRSSAPRASPLRNMAKRMRMTPKCGPTVLYTTLPSILQCCCTLALVGVHETENRCCVQVAMPNSRHTIGNNQRGVENARVEPAGGRWGVTSAAVSTTMGAR